MRDCEFLYFENTDIITETNNEDIEQMYNDMSVLRDDVFGLLQEYQKNIANATSQNKKQLKKTIK